MTRSKWLPAILLAALTPLAAQAHSHLKESTPAEGSTVKAPESIMLMFSEAAKVTALTIQKDGDKEQKLSPLPTEASAHVMVPAPKLMPGKYTVSYRVVSDDGHVMGGKLHFTVSDTAK
jgi:methionine-rich copper-binding protein CopC